jgi:diacylglycerol kinase (ATP)
VKKRIRFIINPIAGTKFKILRPEAIHKCIDARRFEVEIVYTQRAGHATELAAQAALDNIDIVAIAGGDGSVNEAARALKNSTTALAIIPIGSGNGVARKLGVPMKIKKALELINHGTIKTIDGGEVNGEFFLMSPGIGFDAAMLKNFDTFKKRGVWGYVKSIFQTSKKFQPFEVTINLDGKEIKETVYSILLSNIGQLGYGITFDKTAAVEDGVLELVTLKVFPKWKVLWYVIVAFFLDPSRANVIKVYKFKQLKASISATQSLQVDGDYKKEVESVEAHVVEKVLRVLMP